MFSPNQIAELLAIVDRYTLGFLAHSVGSDLLTGEDHKTLANAGFDLQTLKGLNGKLSIDAAFKFGMLSDALQNNTAKTMSYDQFKKFLASGKHIPLNKVEQGALNSLKHQMTSEVKRLSSNVKKDINDKLVYIDKNNRVKYSKVVMNEAKRTIIERRSVAQFAGELGKQTGKWNKDLGRVAEYVMHEAFNEGRLSSIERKGGKVYFDVFQGSCVHCARLYLKNGPGSEPRLFDIDDLRTNGTNAGKKVANWLATVGPIHPFCRCTINQQPEGYEWNPATRAFDIPKKVQRKVQRTSKVKITVGDKTTEI